MILAHNHFWTRCICLKPDEVIQIGSGSVLHSMVWAFSGKKWNWTGCRKWDQAYTIWPDSGYVLAITGHNQTTSKLDPACLLGVVCCHEEDALCWPCLCVCARWLCHTPVHTTQRSPEPGQWDADRDPDPARGHQEGQLPSALRRCHPRQAVWKVGHIGQAIFFSMILAGMKKDFGWHEKMQVCNEQS